ncbi:MAG: hypothetical protein JST38_08435, partial [Bacteroidetes bacterium]|nr:hypothetical protein [Bacteroidota bacterium]
MPDRTIIVQPGQCLEDIALQEYGSIDGAPLVVFANEDVFVDGFSTDLQPGTKLVITGEPIDRPMYDTMRKLGVVPATASDEEGEMLGDFNNDF